MRIPESVLPDGWEQDEYGEYLRCPHDNKIELDGKCPEGCVSPLREQGLI